ncbi:MAG: hypothetical protein PVH31_00745 [Ectothiorhodospiraceae bacterium]|jgi:hypothetical protein
MTGLRRRLAASERRLRRDADRLRLDGRSLHFRLRRRAAHPLSLAGGFSIGFFLGWKRPSPATERRGMASLVWMLMPVVRSFLRGYWNAQR